MKTLVGSLRERRANEIDHRGLYPGQSTVGGMDRSTARAAARGYRDWGHRRLYSSSTAAVYNPLR
jgi:hypothetical protein